MRRRLSRGRSYPASAFAGVLSDPVSGGVNVVVVGVDVETGETVSDAAGDAVLRFGPPSSGYFWRLESVLLWVSGSPGSVASIYAGPERSANLIAGTNKGDLDTADQSPAAYIAGGTVVTVVWAGAGVGNDCIARIQYEIARIA